MRFQRIIGLILVLLLTSCAKEYTVRDVKGSDYLNENHSKSVHDVFELMDALTSISGENNGISYSIRIPWDKNKPDAVNLSKGIDCSRAIWYVFTRAGLPYSPNSTYINTAEMAKSDSLMNQNFSRCPLDQPFQAGDVLVYRTNNDGHVVMAVDHDSKLAWGSHAWDLGEETIRPQKLDNNVLISSVGTEYQRIPGKSGWNHWGNPERKLNACWRHKAFVVERADIKK